MARVLSVSVVMLAASLSAGWGAGPLVTVTDVAAADVPGPQPIRVFPVPAGVGLTGTRLVYDNAVQLGFSSGYGTLGQRRFVAFPLIAPGITIHNVSYQGQWAFGSFRVLGVADNLPGQTGLYTNVEGVPADNRFAAHIPRVGRYAAYDYTAVQLAPTRPVSALGVYVATNSNQYQDVWGIADDNNRLMYRDRNIWVVVLGETDTFATATYVQIACGNLYSPFVLVTAGDPAHLIQSVCLVQDCSVENDAPFGFFDVYVKIPSDVNADGKVNVIDVLTLGSTYNLSQGQTGYNGACDLNGDNSVNAGDLQVLAGFFGKY